MFQKAWQRKIGLHCYITDLDRLNLQSRVHLGTICSFKLVLEQEPGRVLPGFASYGFSGEDFRSEQLLYLKISVFHLQKIQNTALSDYTARNLTGLSQAVDFTGLRQVVNKSRQVCWFRQAVTCLREQVCRKLLTTEP